MLITKTFLLSKFKDYELFSKLTIISNLNKNINNKIQSYIDNLPVLEDLPGIIWLMKNKQENICNGTQLFESEINIECSGTCYNTSLDIFNKLIKIFNKYISKIP